VHDERAQVQQREPAPLQAQLAPHEQRERHRTDDQGADRSPGAVDEGLDGRRPYTRPPKATAGRTTEGTSNGVERVSPSVRTRTRPSRRTTAAIGSISANSERQPSESTTMPETVGPMAGATEITTEFRPMTVPR